MHDDTRTDEELDADLPAAPDDRTGDEDLVPPPIRSKEEIRANAKRNRSKDEWIYVPEWDTRVRIRRLDAAQNEEAVQAGLVGGQWSDFRAALKRIELGCLEPVFDLEEPEDLDMLVTSDPGTIYVLNSAIMVLSKTKEGSIALWQRRFPRGDAEPADAAEGSVAEGDGEVLGSEGVGEVAARA